MLRHTHKAMYDAILKRKGLQNNNKFNMVFTQPTSFRIKMKFLLMGNTKYYVTELLCNNFDMQNWFINFIKFVINCL